MARKHRFERKDALDHLLARYIGRSARRQASLQEALMDAEIGMALYRLRTGAGLTQADLARKIRTSPSVISRLEDADYRGHSMAMLRRVAEALGCQVEIRFVRTRSARGPRRDSPTAA